MPMFPAKDYRPDEFYGNVMIYPRKDRIEKLEIPEELQNEPYFLDHNLIPPLSSQKIRLARRFWQSFWYGKL
ncbi:MAG: hypothetical protein U5L96_10605 [Owenweeksia sp.]|nr:hypothetical protein [Owenweeksia sp.]